jgi:hypothetical protein
MDYRTRWYDRFSPVESLNGGQLLQRYIAFALRLIALASQPDRGDDVRHTDKQDRPDVEREDPRLAHGEATSA